ncbi:universal stress protein [Halopiger aswanensis]|uniref:Nucleotide-binding universal stress UspA family protein n=1 Tax=Halopiger aswanensis TaxID=148449 RepID=A0A419WQJ4_9EURY|nr:universal stress protein [Halopiger aswanensis]RKD97684.1 nucleotide-binding universal stress UspA family protein [Halopiger aswanensis]
MDRALVVAEPTEAATELAQMAGSLAEAGDATVVLIHATTDEEYAARKQAMSSIASSGGTYTTDDAREGARQFAQDLAEAELSEFDIEYETAGYVGEKADAILEAADDHDCDHVYLPGRERSPTGKALFGDATQRVLLEFDGPVTVLTE